MYQLEIRHDNCCRSDSICTLKIHLPLQNVRYQVSDQNLSPDFPYQRSSLVTPGGMKYHAYPRENFKIMAYSEICFHQHNLLWNKIIQLPDRRPGWAWKIPFYRRQVVYRSCKWEEAYRTRWRPQLLPQSLRSVLHLQRKVSI